jgi:hypothetical protein
MTLGYKFRDFGFDSLTMKLSMGTQAPPLIQPRVTSLSDPRPLSSQLLYTLLCLLLFPSEIMHAPGAIPTRLKDI